MAAYSSFATNYEGLNKNSCLVWLLLTEFLYLEYHAHYSSASIVNYSHREDHSLSHSTSIVTKSVAATTIAI